MVNAKPYFFTRYILHNRCIERFMMLGFHFEKGALPEGLGQDSGGKPGFIMNNGGIWHLWGHSWEIEANSDWDKLESIFRLIIDLAARGAKGQ